MRGENYRPASLAASAHLPITSDHLHRQSIFQLPFRAPRSAGRTKSEVLFSTQHKPPLDKNHGCSGGQKGSILAARHPFARTGPKKVDTPLSRMSDKEIADSA
jgi:hypothetical protein